MNIESLNHFAKYLLNYKNDFMGVSRQMFAGYKRHHPESYKFINEFLKTQATWNKQNDLDLNNLYQALVLLYKSVDPNLVRNHSSELLSLIVSKNPNIGKQGTLGLYNRNELKEISDKSKENYDVLAFQGTTENVPRLETTFEANPNLGNDANTNDNVAEVVNNAVIGNNHQPQQLLQHRHENIRNELRRVADTQGADFVSELSQIIQLLSQEDQSSTQIKQTNIQSDFKIESNKIKNFYRRILKKQNHVSLIEFHINNETTPSQLFFDKFPQPFLTNDPEAIDEYNSIIRETQVKLMRSNIKHLKKQITKLELNLKTIRDMIPSNEDTDSLFKTIRDKVELDLKPEFEKADAKAKRLVSRPFIVKVSNSVPQDRTYRPQTRTNKKQNKNVLTRNRTDFIPNRTEHTRDHDQGPKDNAQGQISHAQIRLFRTQTRTDNTQNQTNHIRNREGSAPKRNNNTHNRTVHFQNQVFNPKNRVTKTSNQANSDRNDRTYQVNRSNNVQFRTNQYQNNRFNNYYQNDINDNNRFNGYYQTNRLDHQINQPLSTRRYQQHMSSDQNFYRRDKVLRNQVQQPRYQVQQQQREQPPIQSHLQPKNNNNTNSIFQQSSLRTRRA